MRLERAVLMAALLPLIAACSGGGTQAVPATPPQGGPVGASMARVAFTMNWNSGTVNSRVKPAYVPATARSVSVSVNGGTSQYLNAPSTTLTIDAPVGTDTFSFHTYDGQNGQGNVLSQATVSQAIVLGSANTVAAVLNGVVASLALSLSNPSPNAGVPATVTINASARDADGNTIVGPGDYSTPIKLSIVDPANSGTLSLSAASIPNSSTSATLTYSGGTLSSASISATATGVSNVSVAFAPTPTIYQFSIPVSANKPQYIAAGADGNMWFTESVGNAIGRITPAGVVTEFPIPTSNAGANHIIGAADGNLWFTESNANKIAKITTSGTITEFSTLFAPPPNDNPSGLVDRGDGNVWYVANGSSRLGYLSYNGSLAGETSIPTASSGPWGIATAPDSYLYYTENAADKIGRAHDLFSAQSEISLTAGSSPRDIVRGPDGNLWFTENGRNIIGRLSPNSFSVTGEFPTLTPLSGPSGITVGADGALWFTEQGALGSTVDKIGRITTGGTVTEYSSPISGLQMTGIATAPDGSLWFCEPGAGANPGRIGKLVY